MKQSFILFLGICLLASCTGNDAPVADNTAADTSKSIVQTPPDPTLDSANFTSIQWIDSVNQELGKVKEGQVLEVSWKFKNSGTKPLVIVNAQASCGCTVAEKPEQPIEPGGEGIIKAKFNSAGQHEGEHTKSVAVQTNTTGTTYHNLTFKVNVEKK